MERKWKSRRKGKFAFIGLAIIIGVLLLVYLLQYLWNTLMTDIFDLKAISYWQAFGLLLLSKILLGAGSGRPPGRFRRHCPGCRNRAGQEHPGLEEEDRMKFREEWKRRFANRCSDRKNED